MSGAAKGARKGPRYVAEIQGANGSRAYALGRGEDGRTLEVFAATEGSLAWHALRVQPEFSDEVRVSDSGNARADYYQPKVALFATREAARDAALAARWNNQLFRVRAARGKAREQGHEVWTPPLGWTSCQEGVTS